MPARVVRLGDLLRSPAIAVLLDLERAGCSVCLASDAVEIAPIKLVTPELRAAIQRHRRDLKLLVQVLDETVQARAQRFAAQRAAGSEEFLWLEEPVLEAGVCFSCGSALPSAPRGRCWRCALAWKLVVGVPILAPEASASDMAA